CIIKLRSVFLVPSQNFKIRAIPNATIVSHTSTVSRKNATIINFSHKLSFDWFFVHYLRISKYWPFPMYFPLGSHKSMVSLKNVTVINFAQCRAESSFDRFFVHLQGISKYCPFPTYLPMGSCKSMVSLKNGTVINFAKPCSYDFPWANTLGMANF
ncbi:hypothetical protein BHE74_00021183, partial [Ensete ventricosum]